MNAVFERDYLRVSTSRRFLWMRAALAATVAVIVGFRLLAAYAQRDFSGVGAGLMRVTLLVGAVAVLGAAPGTFATVLVHARQPHTLPTLLASPITPFQLAWGAFAARAAGLGVFVLATVPPIVLALAFGGIHGQQVVSGAVAVYASVLCAAAISFALSAFSRRTGVAVVSAYLGTASLFAALGAIGSLMRSTNSTATSEWAAALSPLHAISLSHSSRADPRIVLSATAVLFLGSLVLSGVAILIATLRLSWEARGGLDASPSSAARAPRPIVRANPVLDRELSPSGARSRSGGVLIAVLVLSEAAYAATVMWTGERTSIALFSGFLSFQIVLLLLAAASSGATAFASERESGALDLLRATPLTPFEIIEGKLAGILRSQIAGLAIVLVHLCWGAAAGILSPWGILAAAAAGGIVVSAWAVFGMSQSLDTAEPHRAVVRTMTAMGIVGILLASFAGLIVSATLSDLRPHDPWLALTMAGGANPVLAIAGAAAPFRIGGSTADSSNLPAAEESWRTAAVIMNSTWLLLHVLAGWCVFRRLSNVYRTRFGG